MNKKIKNLQKVIKTIFMSPKYNKNFHGYRVQGTTINILGALKVLTEFDNTLTFKEQINLFNDKYYDLISSFEMTDYLYNDLHAFYFFCDPDYDFDIYEDEKKYQYIVDFESIKNLSTVILKFANNFKDQTIENQEYLEKLSYFIALTYISNHEKDKVSIFISESFKDEDVFYEDLSITLLDVFNDEIEIFTGSDKPSSNGILNNIYDLEEHLFIKFMKNEQINKEYFDSLKNKLIFKIIPEYKIYDFAGLFLKSYNNKISDNQIFLFSNIIINIFEKMLKDRFSN